MHVGMVTINGEKMSKSLGNIKSIKHVLDNWGSNVIRLFCLSGHYSKPIDYSEKLLKENLTKWRQVETCYYELIHVNNEFRPSEIKSIIVDFGKEFDNALESDINTHLALLAFFKLVKEVNYLAAKEKLNSNDAKMIIPEFERILDILGLIIPKITSNEKNEIDNMIIAREQLRKEKKFQDADIIRDKLIDMNIELIDHKGKTIWIRKEKIKADI
jgi:cysteinyl-tRNA synthetase